MASAVHRPTTVEELTELVGGGGPFELRGGGTRAEVGAPRKAAVLDMTGFSGVIDYDPAELVLTVGAGTPLAEVETLVAGSGQMLAFEPPGAPGSTIGGVVASGAAGSRRLSRGGARDHLLGFKGVSGRGEALIGGAKVVKNVTGYDMPKLIAGSWGRLVALTEVTLKVLPRPEMHETLVLDGLSPGCAVAAMAKALGSPGDVAAAAHDPASGLTGLRLEGFAPSVAARRELLTGLLGEFATVGVMGESDAVAFWSSMRHPFPDADDLFKVSVPPSRAADFIAQIEATGAPVASMIDWGGALIWLSYAAEFADLVRASVEAFNGHAVLWRAPVLIRSKTPAFHERPRAVHALEVRVRAAFDPQGVFETGRFLDVAHAD
jgi:glycolate oxidase FAD binding subunit